MWASRAQREYHVCDGPTPPGDVLPRVGTGPAQGGSLSLRRKKKTRPPPLPCKQIQEGKSKLAEYPAPGGARGEAEWPLITAARPPTGRPLEEAVTSPCARRAGSGWAVRSREPAGSAARSPRPRRAGRWHPARSDNEELRGECWPGGPARRSNPTAVPEEHDAGATLFIIYSQAGAKLHARLPRVPRG
jgi:hypothetical protein